MIAAASFSPDPRDVLQHPRGDLSNRKRSLDTFVHEVPPSQRIETYAETDGMPSPTTPRNPGEAKGKTRTTLHRSLTLHVTEPAKVVAKKTGASPDTIDSHKQGNVPQSWAQLIAYCRAYPAFALDVVEAMGLDLDRDRESYAAFLSLMKQARGE